MDKSEAELFNEVYKEICSIIGLDAAIAIYQMYKGQQITFPIHLFNAKRIQTSIIKEYDGSNIRELAKKYEAALARYDGERDIEKAIGR